MVHVSVWYKPDDPLIIMKLVDSWVLTNTKQCTWGFFNSRFAFASCSIRLFSMDLVWWAKRNLHIYFKMFTWNKDYKTVLLRDRKRRTAHAPRLVMSDILWNFFVAEIFCHWNLCRRIFEKKIVKKKNLKKNYKKVYFLADFFKPIFFDQFFCGRFFGPIFLWPIFLGPPNQISGTSGGKILNYR